MRSIFLSLGSSRVRLGVGLLLACLLLAQILSDFDGNKLTAAPSIDKQIDRDGVIRMSNAERIASLAQTDHVALFELCLQNYHHRVKDYTCTLTKQERIDGQMSQSQVIGIRFKEDPFSVLMTWQVNAPRGDKMLYVERDPNGDNKMYIHPSGFAGRLIRVVERDPEDPEVRKSSLRSIKEFGFARGLQSLIDVYAQADANGDLVEQSYLGTSEVDGRPTIVLKRVLRPREGVEYPGKLTLVEIDQELLVPVRIRSTDFHDQPLCDYTYTNLKFNVGLTDADFTRQATGL